MKFVSVILLSGGDVALLTDCGEEEEEGRMLSSGDENEREMEIVTEKCGDG